MQNMGHRKNKLEYEPILTSDEEAPIEYCNLDEKLNRRQRNFIWIAVNNPRLSLVESAYKAGYTSPRQMANKLMNNPIIRKEYNYLMNEAKKKYELNYDRAVQDLYDIRDKAMEAGSFNAAISAQNSLLKVGGLIVDRKEVMFGKVDQMSREEVENRLKQLMGNVVEDVALASSDAKLDGNEQSQEEIDAMTDLEEESIYDVEVLKEIKEEQEGSPNVEE
jgi:phage terminase small subunit